jgi:hypothetical protein
VTLRCLALLGMWILSALGCGGVPFRETDLAPVESLDPETVRENFALALPASFRIVNTVTFEFKGRAFAAIGYTQVDTASETFTVVGLHPAAGVKLFEVSGDSRDATASFALEAFAVQGDIARAIGDDTRRMYFDRLPAAGARVSKERRRILFRQQTGDGEIEFVFAGHAGVLIEKGYYERGSKVWSVRYYEYRRDNGKLYPGGIILDHHEYGYRLLVRLREIRS